MSNEKKFRLDMSFVEALRRFAQTDPDELAKERKKSKQEIEEIDKYVEERKESIRKGARRTNNRFRL